MRHLLDDSGHYEVKDRNLLLPVAKCFTTDELFNPGNASKIAWDIYKAAGGLYQSYNISKDMGGLGGCKTVEDFWAHTPTDPLEAALLPLFKEMVDAELYPRYFPYVALDIICDILIYARLNSVI